MSTGGPTPCMFCRETERAAAPDPRLIYEDALVRVSHWFEDGSPAYRGALVVQTRRHTDAGLASLTDEEGGRIGVIVAQLSRALKELVGAAWTYTYCFTEGYRHVHQFVVARHPHTPPEYVRLGLNDWEGAPRITLDEMLGLSRELAKRIRIPNR